MSFFDEHELAQLGFRAVGRGVKLSRKASIYNARNITLGDHSRIDDFCVISAGGEAVFSIGDYVHISCYCALIGAANITMDAFSGLSSRVSIFSSSDDFSGAAMTNPTVPAEFTNVKSAPVVIGGHAVIGCGAIVLPGVTVAYGCSIGAQSLVKRSTKPYGIYAGSPLVRLKERERGFEAAEARLRET